MKLISYSLKKWSECNNTKHFFDYSKYSNTGKVIRFRIAALLLVPVGGFGFAPMTTIQAKNIDEENCSISFGRFISFCRLSDLFQSIERISI